MQTSLLILEEKGEVPRVGQAVKNTKDMKWV